MLYIAGLFLLLGIGFVSGGICCIIIYNRKQTDCTASVQGEVVGYNFAGNAPRPVIRYIVDGVTYERKKNYRTVVIKSAFNTRGTEMWVDEKNNMHIKRNSMVADYRSAIEKLYPLGTQIPVYYNPNNPSTGCAGMFDSSLNMLGKVLGFIGLGLFLFGLLALGVSIFTW